MLVNVIRFILLIAICSTAGATVLDRLNFLREFLMRQERPSNIVSFLNIQKYEQFVLHKGLTKTYNLAVMKRHAISYTTANEHDVYLADIADGDIKDLLLKALQRNLLKYPSRWIVFFNSRKYRNTNNLTHSGMQDDGIDLGFDHDKVNVEGELGSVFIAPDTEVYIVFELHKIRQHWPLVWDEHAIWHNQEGFDRPRPKDVLAMRRRNLLGSRMVAVATILENSTLHDMPDYLNRAVDSPTKINYYFTHHLFDWMNATGLVNRSLSYGYKQPDGNWDGNVRELLDGRSDFSASILWMMADRVPILNYVRPTSPAHLSFIFKKPSLATVTNIYALPFSMGVWVSSMLLVLVSAAAMALGDFTLESHNHQRKMTAAQRILQSIHDTLCLVFQQGTYYDPITITGRQILLIGLMVFMFLYTAYSANVVALIQSTTNGITSVEALMNSPLQCGAENLMYQRPIFKYEMRPTHRAFWLKKGEPQAENFFVSIEEGIRRVREGLYAFHVLETSASDEIQKTFLEHEKCNLGLVKYTASVDPHFTISRKSHFVEALRIGSFRLMENGLQVRSIKRITASLPKCGAGTAMFTPVTILYVIPIFKSLLLIYTASLFIFVLEVFTHRREKRLKILKRHSVDTIS